MNLAFRRRVFDILELGQRHPRLARIVGALISVLVLLNVAAAVFETLPELKIYQRSFAAFELLSVGLFLTEYLARLWSITASPEYAHPISGRIRYVFTPLALVDLLAILPVFLGWGASLDLRALRLIRIVRILRILKIARYSNSVRLLGVVLAKTKGELAVCVFVAAIVMVVAATAMFQAERAVQPEAFSSVPATMWWAIVTLTTVGYGDVAPVTSLGRVIGATVALFGVGLVALPAGILGGAFVEELRAEKAARPAPLCPHCGKALSGEGGRPS